MYNLPQKEIIVNDDSQVVLKASTDSGVTWINPYLTGTNLVPATATHQFQLEGFLNPMAPSNLNLLASATRVRKTTGVAAIGETATFTVAVVATGIVTGDEIMLRTDSIDLTPTEFQNKFSEKRYQSSKTTGTLATVIQHIADTINADKFSRVTALVGRNNTSPVVNDSAKIVFVSKQPGTTVDFVLHKAQGAALNSISFTKISSGVTYVGTVDGTNVTNAAATVGVNSYNYLKNINWAKNFNIDQNLSWMPLPGKLYNSYYFEVNGPVLPSAGNRQVPNEPHIAARTAYNIWALQGTVLDGALEFFRVDMNV